jgi:ABC-type transport system involved in multi-copper enzyme maturation permease subunit
MKPLALVVGSYRAEWLKLTRRPAIWILGILLCLGILTLGYILIGVAIVIIERSATSADQAIPGGAAQSLRVGLLPDVMVSQVIPLLSTLGGPIGMILGALTIGGEYSWGTLKTILTQRPGRLALTWGKLLALAPLLLIFCAGALLLGLLGSLVAAALQGAALTPPSALELLKGLGAGWLILAVWTMFGVALATVLRSSALAIGLGLIYSLVLESVVSGVALFVEQAAQLRNALLGANASALSSYFSGGGSTIPPERATLILLVYLAIFTAITALVIRVRDVT